MRVKSVLLLQGAYSNEWILSYTESEQVCKFYVTVPLGITHSKQLLQKAGPAKNEYICFERDTDLQFK